METVICPITGKEIDGDSCYCTVLVMDGEAPEQCLPEGITKSKENRQTCLSCKYHKDE